MGKIGCFETSVIKYQSMPHKIPEERECKPGVAQILGAWSPWLQHFLLWHLKFLYLQYGTHNVSPFEVASRFLATHYILGPNRSVTSSSSNVHRKYFFTGWSGRTIHVTEFPTTPTQEQWVRNPLLAQGVHFYCFCVCVVPFWCRLRRYYFLGVVPNTYQLI